jgi:nicotinamidase-related amidase
MKKISRRTRRARRSRIRRRSLKFGEFEELEKFEDLKELSHAKYTEELKEKIAFVKDKIKVGQKDVLFIIDMQYDFVDQPFTEFNGEEERIIYAEGGAFSAPQSSDIVPKIVELVPKFKNKNSLIIATKDYHPEGHCSFKEEKREGYPPHCVVGTKGAKIVKPIWKAIRSLGNAYIAFKGFHPKYDSYSALEYDKTTATPTVRCEANDDTSWTGSFVVKTTDNQYRKLRFGADVPYIKDYDRSDDYSKQYNPPEDEFKELVRACTDMSDGEYLSKSNCKLQHVEELLNSKKIEPSSKIFVCGLVGDICVLDTAINLRKNGYDNVYIIFDLTRMVYIPGPGYIMPPEKYAKLLKDFGIKIIESENIIK